MGYSVDPILANCYEGTSCLINKCDIHDEKVLLEIEGNLSVGRALLWMSSPKSTSFDLEHYKLIHKFLFEELYDWAGEFRTVDISKKGTSFCSVDELEEVAFNCFKRLKENNYFLEMGRDEFVDALVDFYCVTNMLHPFREGNGRTQRVFIEQLVQHNGYDFSFSDVDTDELMIATINAANGTTDYLKALFDGAIHSFG